MPPELLQTALVNVLQHAGGASRDLPPLLQAFDLALAVGLGLAKHEVVIVRLAAGADKKGGTEEGSRGGADLGHAGNRGREGGGVDEDLLVEAVVDGSAKEGSGEAEWWSEVGGGRKGGMSVPGLSRRHGGGICAGNGQPGDVKVVELGLESLGGAKAGGPGWPVPELESAARSSSNNMNFTGVFFRRMIKTARAIEVDKSAESPRLLSHPCRDNIHDLPSASTSTAYRPQRNVKQT